MEEAKEAQAMDTGDPPPGDPVVEAMGLGVRAAGAARVAEVQAAVEAEAVVVEVVAAEAVEGNARTPVTLRHSLVKIFLRLFFLYPQ
jgi:hypothetical protein